MSLYDVLYRDGDVIVVNKTPGLLSQPDRSGDPDLLTLLSRETGRPVFPVHRLDRGVGGLVAVACRSLMMPSSCVTVQYASGKLSYWAQCRVCTDRSALYQMRSGKTFCTA